MLEEAQSEHAAAMAAVQAQLADAVRQQQALQGVQNTARRIPQLEQELEQCRTENEHLISKVSIAPAVAWAARLCSVPSWSVLALLNLFYLFHSLSQFVPSSFEYVFGLF